MSRVIKNNDGVAIVEGTPAASLVKDVDKFFAAKPPQRMAGEAIKPQKIGAERLTKPSEKPMPVLETLREGSKFSESAIRSGRKREVDDLVKQQVKEEAEGRKEETPSQEKEMKREEALDKTREFKRQRFAERSADEQEATEGRFITTLGR
tara:strand:+ start:1118 stop:1570 length:453 start_codon:yes stop_codon:yes gene_type:complete